MLDASTWLYGCKCSGCGLVISPDELVMRAIHNVYHTECFKCDECGDKLEKGDEFILRDGKLYCNADFNVADQKSDIEVFSSDENESFSTTSPRDQFDKRIASSCKRPRTILTAQQRQDFKAAFELTPKPCRKVREQLSKETGLSVRVVQVWFQNQRAKLKKMQKKSEEGTVSDSMKKNSNSGKVTKKKSKSKILSINGQPKSPNVSGTLEHMMNAGSSTSTSDFNLPPANNNPTTTSFESILDISSNYASQATLSSYYGGGGSGTSLTSSSHLSSSISSGGDGPPSPRGGHGYPPSHHMRIPPYQSTHSNHFHTPPPLSNSMMNHGPLGGATAPPGPPGPIPTIVGGSGAGGMSHQFSTAPQHTGYNISNVHGMPTPSSHHSQQGGDHIQIMHHLMNSF